MKLPEVDREQGSDLCTIAEAPTSFADIPIELQLKIFSYFTKTELCATLGLVCKSWRNLAKHPLLWKEINVFYPFTCDNRNYSKVLQSCAQLRVLKIEGMWHPFPKEISGSSRFFPLLKELRLKDMLISIQDTFRPLALNCKCLDTVSLVSCRITTNLLSVIFDIASLPQLKSFTYVKPVTSDLDDFCLKVLCSKNRNTLRELRIEGRLITDYGMSYLRLCNHLEALHIAKAICITRVSLKALSKLKLKIFKLNIPFSFVDVGHSYNLRSEDLVEFLSSPHRMNLQEIGFQRVNLDGQGLKMIAQNCSKLRALALRYCEDLTDRDLSAYLESRPPLVSLDLSGCIGLNSEILLKVPMFTPKLEKLELSFLSVTTEEVVYTIKQSLPELELDWWGDECVFSKGNQNEDPFEFYSRLC